MMSQPASLSARASTTDSSGVVPDPSAIQSLAEILNHADRPTERNVLDTLTETDRNAEHTPRERTTEDEPHHRQTFERFGSPQTVRKSIDHQQGVFAGKGLQHLRGLFGLRRGHSSEGFVDE